MEQYCKRGKKRKEKKERRKENRERRNKRKEEKKREIERKRGGEGRKGVLVVLSVFIVIGLPQSSLSLFFFIIRYLLRPASCVVSPRVSPQIILCH